jgi:hypothetical protein
MEKNSKFNVTTKLFDYVKYEGEETVTLHGLENWTNHMYEILGWMTLADRHNNSEKVASYINSIPKLMQAIQSRMEGSSTSERKDLEALGRKVEHLYNVCDKLFNYQKLSNKLCAKCENKSKKQKLVPIHREDDIGSFLGGAKVHKKKVSKKTSKKTSKKNSKTSKKHSKK